MKNQKNNRKHDKVILKVQVYDDTNYSYYTVPVASGCENPIENPIENDIDDEN